MEPRAQEFVDRLAKLGVVAEEDGHAFKFVFEDGETFRLAEGCG